MYNGNKFVGYFGLPGETRPFDWNAPVQPWPIARSARPHIKSNEIRSNLLEWEDLTPDEKCFLEDALLEAFTRNYAHSVAVLVPKVFTFNEAFAQAAVFEAARQGRGEYLNVLWPWVENHFLQSAVVGAALEGNQWEVAQRFARRAEPFEMSSDCFQKILRKNASNRLTVWKICRRHANCATVNEHIEQYCEKYASGRAGELKKEWAASEKTMLQEETAQWGREGRPRKL